MADWKVYAVGRKWWAEPFATTCILCERTSDHRHQLVGGRVTQTVQVREGEGWR